MNRKIDEQTNWHSLQTDEIKKKFEVDIATGLSFEEVEKRRGKYGWNKITVQKGLPLWLRFLQQFNQPLIYILIAASCITLILKEYIDATVIFAVVIVNAFVGFLQESKAIKALVALSGSMTSTVTVLRVGKEQHISSTELVPGDVVIIASGDKIAADMRLIHCRDLQTNESPLTGESVPVEKMTDTLKENTPLADRQNMLYASTFATYGRAKAIVTTIGDKSEVGRISQLITSAENLQTPLTRKIAHFSHILLFVILGLSGLTLIFGLLRGDAPVEIFMSAVALAVGAIPEGLPAVVTITLAIGVSRMAKHHAIIRKLPAVETLGSTGIICSDKTGTLTENQMTVQEIYSGGHDYLVSGVGYAFDGEIKKHSGEALASKALQENLTAGYLCNDSRIVQKEGNNQVEGDPTEGALIVSWQKAKALFDELPEYKRIDAIPFESEYQYMATLHRMPNDDKIVYLKGSLEKILAKCKNEMDDKGGFHELNVEKIDEQAKRMAEKGLRVLAFARMNFDDRKENIEHEDIAGEITFLGLQGMIDPPRPEAIEAVKNCHTAGILVKMITGDHLITAKAIAGQLKIKSDLEKNDSEQDLKAISGSELEKMTDEQMQEIVEETSVFARVTPEQKLRLLKALQAKGYIAAMTGDGVNDAPALKQANIGIAMGQSGTEVAKEAADMILTDDNFASIEKAVEEGRCVFDNLRKFIVWTLPTNLGEALAIMIAILGGLTLPIAPVQILWINMTTALCLGMMLAFEPKEADLMQRPPRDPAAPLVTTDLMVRTIAVGILLAAGVYLLYFYEIRSGLSVEEARTAAVATLVFGELFYLFSCRSLNKSMFSVSIFSNPLLILGVFAMIGLQLVFTYVPLMNKLFASAPISLETWGHILLVGIVILIVTEVEKPLRNKFRVK